jgi:uncharacterized membrane protein
MQWFYAKNREQMGPVDDAGIRDLVRRGVVRADDLVWNETMGAAWRKAGELPELFPAPAAFAVPPPPPSEYAYASGRPDAAPGRTAAQSMPSGPYVPTAHNRDLMSAARARLHGNWTPAVLVALLYSGISMCLSGFGMIPFVGFLANIGSILVAGPLALGLVMFYLPFARGGSPKVSELFSGFDQFFKAIAANLLMGLFILLWTLLLIVPGIIAGYRYSMTFYLLHDHPGLGPLEAIRLSKEMMAGNKWKLFCLHWRFFGWALLCILTCGIGFLWLVPYMQVSQAHFYDDLRGRKQEGMYP